MLFSFCIQNKELVSKAREDICVSLKLSQPTEFQALFQQVLRQAQINRLLIFADLIPST